MAGIDVEKIRNVALLSHSGAGKTSVVEAVLYASGVTGRMGSVEEGNTVTDFDPEEIDRKHTITSSLAYCDWSGCRMNLIDTPGLINFIEDARGCLRISDGVIMVVSALYGVKAETEKLWRYASEFSLPSMVFINMMDKENARFSVPLDEITGSFGLEAIPLNMPIGEGENLQGVVDLIALKAFKSGDNRSEEMEIPPEMKGQVDEYRKKLVEKIAEADDALLEKYLEGAELTNDEIRRGVREATLFRRFLPVVCGSATENCGITQLLDSAILCLPSPVDTVRVKEIAGKHPDEGSDTIRKPAPEEPLSAYVFKTIADPFAGKLSLIRVFSGELKADSTVLNSSKSVKERIGQVSYLLGKKQNPAQKLGPGEIGVVAKLKETVTGDTFCDDSHPLVFDSIRFTEPIISYAIEPKSKGDEDKVSMGLHRILEEDPTLRFHRVEETNEMIISGMGQMHIEVTLQKLKRKFGVEVIMRSPKIPYRETIRVTAKSQGKYKKQSGGKGQYGDCWIEIAPLPSGEGFEFVNKIVGGSIPRQYIPAVEKGIVEKMKEGIIAGYPLVDVRATVYDGSYHAVDSSEMAFKIAGSLALKKAVMDARPVLLEPIVKIEVITPDETLGSIIGDLNAKRGKVQGMEPQSGNNQKVEALVPMAEMLTYANQLHSLTSGRGMYTMEFSHYEDVPAHLTKKITEERKKEEEES